MQFVKMGGGSGDECLICKQVNNHPLACRLRPAIALRQYAQKYKLRYQQLIARLEKGDTTTDERGVFIRTAQGDVTDEEDEV